MLTIDYGIYARGIHPLSRRDTDVLSPAHGARKRAARIRASATSRRTSHFTALEEHGESCGLQTERFETLAQMLLAAGEPDQFAAALGGRQRSCGGGCN